MMGYRLFYSYQSDTKSALNHRFIRNAIDTAVARITEYKIVVVEGFYGIGGNPPLLQTMLAQSKGSDIFVGDITFTSSMIWQSRGVNIHEDSDSYLVEIDKPANLKPAPNPNVLIETGYSWALKNLDRTILIMNTAFGHPSAMPVDMQGLRWPITYNLSEERAAIAAKHKKEHDQLTDALEAAIRFTIKTSIDYQIDRLRPCMILSQWEEYHPYPYQLTPIAKERILEIRDQIENKDKSIRILGKNGIGKTRLVLESFRSNGELPDLKLDDRIVYYDYDSAISGDISKQLSVLREIDQQKILVLDNCPEEEHKRLEKHFRYSKVRIISIDTIDELVKSNRADVFIPEELRDEAFQLISAFSFPSEDPSFFMETMENDLDRFVYSIRAGADVSDISKPPLELLKILIGHKNEVRGAIPFLTAVALFQQIGVSGNYKDQVALVREIFVHCSQEDIESLLEDLETRKLIRRQGNYILLNGFNEELVLQWIGSDIENLFDLVKEISKRSMWYNIKSPFIKWLENSKHLEAFDEEVLKNDAFIDSDEGAHLLHMLSSSYPNQVLETIKNKINRM